MNVKTKLIVVSSLLAIVPLIIATILLERVSTTMASEALEIAAQHQLISIRDTKKTQLVAQFKI